MVVALLGGILVLFHTQAMWTMDSANACSWNATMNCSATMGINIQPVFIIIIVIMVIIGIVATRRGF